MQLGQQTWTSREFQLHVGIRILVFFDHDDGTVCASALIDNSSIPNYFFEAKVIAWYAAAPPSVASFGDKMKNPKTCYEVRDPGLIDWSTLKIAYFGPDDDRIIRTETLIDQDAISKKYG
jgi:hypothetical protein